MTYSFNQAFQRGILQHEGVKHLLCLFAHIQQNCVVRGEKKETGSHQSKASNVHRSNRRIKTNPKHWREQKHVYTSGWTAPKLLSFVLFVSMCVWVCGFLAANTSTHMFSLWEYLQILPISVPIFPQGPIQDMCGCFTWDWQPVKGVFPAFTICAREIGSSRCLAGKIMLGWNQHFLAVFTQGVNWVVRQNGETVHSGADSPQ